MPGWAGNFGTEAPRSIQREFPRVAPQIRRRVERLTVDRSIFVLARERRVTDIGRIRVIGEFAVARQHFGAGVQPGALGDVNPGARPLLIGHVWPAWAVI